MPVEQGSVTARAAAMAIAASQQFPPWERIWFPMAEARGCEVDTMERVESTGERVRNGWRLMVVYAGSLKE